MLDKNNEITFEIQVRIDKKKNEEIYRVTLDLKGNKEKEYTLEIVVSGYFSFDSTEELLEEDKEMLINKNAVAILMPYLRSEVSLITAQPEVDCVVLPPFSINKMMDE